MPDEPALTLSPSPPQPGPSPRALDLVALGTGVAVMTVEMAAGRLIAPWYGSSTMVWAALIATVLGSLALGALLGGRLSRGPEPLRALRRLLAGSGLGVALVPWIAGPTLRASLQAFADGDLTRLAGALVLVLLLLAVPVALVGACSPLLLHLATRGRDEVGAVAARLGALGTVGSLLGTLLPGIVLVPLLGSAVTLAAGGGLLLALAVACRPAGGVRALAVGLLALLPVVLAVHVPAPVFGTGRTVLVRESAHQLLRVVDHGALRTLRVGEGYAVQSVQYRDGRLPLVGVWPFYALAPGWTRGGRPDRVLLIGLGAGTSADLLLRLYPRARITGVELDAEIVAVGRSHFGLPPAVEVIVDDGRRVLETERRRFDLILVDAFRFPYLPFQLVTAEAFARYDALLADGGALVLNVGRDGRRDAVVEAVLRTAGETFPVIRAVEANREMNTLIVATRHPPDQDAGLGPAQLPADVRARLESLPKVRARQARADAWRLTDDRAPIEWLTDWTVAARLLALGAGPTPGAERDR